MIRRATFPLLTAMLFSGCASIVRGPSQLFAINSTPDGAAIRIEDEHGTIVHTATTPTSVTLPKGGGYFDGKDYTVTFEKPGFEAHTAKLVSQPSGWYLAGNIVFGGLIGWLIVDPLTGAMWTYEKDTLNENLVAKGTAGVDLPHALPTLTVLALDQVPAERRGRLVRIVSSHRTIE